MNRSRALAFTFVALLGLAWIARGDLADVYLKSGLALRGEVQESETEIVLRNAAGEVRIPRSDVLRVVKVAERRPEPEVEAPPPAPAATQAVPRAAGPATPGRAEAPTSVPPETQPAEIPPPPHLKPADIQRLRLAELAMQGPPEVVRVRFKRRPRQADLSTQVLEQVRTRPDFQREWAEVLTRGQPHEKLQLIARLTGLEHVDRIEIESDPLVFDTFRRRVLPLVARGCSRSGCHGGQTARHFRFPLGATTDLSYAYTVFALLDGMETRHGPMLNREHPVQSALIAYMLPREGNPRAHAPTPARGAEFRPVLRGLEDRNYEALLEWIETLRVPHPDYGLRYGSEKDSEAPATAPATLPAAATEPAR